MLLHLLYSERLDHRDWMQGNIVDRHDQTVENHEGEQEYWFDFVADTGDSELASFAVACLCLDDLSVHGEGAAKRGDRVTLGSHGPGTKRQLPCGDFLLVGGDTAYPIADLPTLRQRFKNPFGWAFADLKAR